MAQLRYYTTVTVHELHASIGARLDWYYSRSGRPPQVALSGLRESRLPEPNLKEQLTVNPSQPFRTDAANALIVYKSLEGLTPHQASEERVWVYLCHSDCSEYVSARWLQRRPPKDEDAVREVRNHFFAVGNRALIRDNGVSRLWWLGKIANEIAPENPLEFLTILLHRQDVRSALIERPSVSMNRHVLQGIYRVMQHHWNNGRTLFERDSFRKWMVALNRRGGVVLLDALPDQALADLLNEEAERALA